jgi:hypothetical protein
LFSPRKKKEIVIVNMDFKNYHISYIIIIIILLIINFILLNKSITINFNNDLKKFPIDYQIEDLKECYLTVHNFVSINTTVQDQSSINDSSDIKNKFDFKTFIYSYTKPYLLELVQNSTKDCLCCPI